MSSKKANKKDKATKSPARYLNSTSNSDDQHKKGHSSGVISYRLHKISFFDYRPQAINCLCCDEENQQLALSRSDGCIELWSFLGSPPDMYQHSILHTSSDTSIEALIWHEGILYSAGLVGDLVEYDMKLLRCKRQISCHAGAIWCLSLDSQKKRIAAGTEEGCVVIFEMGSDGFEYTKCLQKQEERMLSIDWHFDGKMIVTGGIDNIRVWSVNTGNAIQRITIGRQSDKETLVWGVRFLRDMTLVSGDSRGYVSFWDGDHATLLKEFDSHRADVLSLCVNSAEDQVFATGIDQTLRQFQLSVVRTDDNSKTWLMSGMRIQHSHDVRAVAMMGDLVVTGGVDCALVAQNFTTHNSFKSVPIPHHSLIHVAKDADLVLLQYTKYLQLWTLGTTNTPLGDRDPYQQALPLDSKPLNLLQLKTRSGESIICSNISSDGKWIAYADRESLRIFRVNLNINAENESNLVSASRVKGLHPSILEDSIRCMTFNSDGTQLILGCVNGAVKLVSLLDNGPFAELSCVCPPSADAGVIHLLAISADNTNIVISDTNFNVKLYELSNSNLQQKSNLPRRDTYVTALCFSPDGKKVAIAYCDHEIVECNIVQSLICNQNEFLGAKDFKTLTLQTVQKIISLSYCKRNPSLLIVQDCLGLRLWNTEQGVMLRERHLEDCKYLMHFEELSEDFAICVRKSVSAFNDALPAVLFKKKFIECK